MATWITVNGARVDLDGVDPRFRAAIAAQADKPSTAAPAAPSAPAGVPSFLWPDGLYRPNPPPQNAGQQPSGLLTPAQGAADLARRGITAPPGGTFAGMDGSGTQVIWQMPDGRLVRTNAKGAEYIGGTMELEKPPVTDRAATRRELGPSGVTKGEEEDYIAMASSVLRRLGFENEAMQLQLKHPSTFDEIAMFVRGGMKDAASIELFYRTKPSLLAVNPGLRYNLSREDYYGTRAGVETAYEQRFGATGTGDVVRAKAKSPTVGAAPPEAEWLTSVFQERFTPNESASMFSDYFKRLGVAPTSQDVGPYRTRSQEKYRDRAVEPAFRDIEDMRRGGPTTPGLTKPRDNQIFGRTR